MAWIPGATFLMGSDRQYPEAPARKVTVDGFWIDACPVTNREFGRFVRKTGYVTVAERAPDPADYPGARPPVRAGLLPPLPPGRPDGPAHRRVRFSPGLPLRRAPVTWLNAAVVAGSPAMDGPPPAAG